MLLISSVMDCTVVQQYPRHISILNNKIVYRQLLQFSEMPKNYSRAWAHCTEIQNRYVIILIKLP